MCGVGSTTLHYQGGAQPSKEVVGVDRGARVLCARVVRVEAVRKIKGSRVAVYRAVCN